MWSIIYMLVYGKIAHLLVCVYVSLVIASIIIEITSFHSMLLYLTYFHKGNEREIIRLFLV